MIKATVQASLPAVPQATDYPASQCVRCLSHPADPHYAGSCVWHVPSTHFAKNGIVYTVRLYGLVPECDCPHGCFSRTKRRTPQCAHVRFAQFKEAQRTDRAQAELFDTPCARSSSRPASTEAEAQAEEPKQTITLESLYS